MLQKYESYLTCKSMEVNLRIFLKKLTYVVVKHYNIDTQQANYHQEIIDSA